MSKSEELTSFLFIALVKANLILCSSVRRKVFKAMTKYESILRLKYVILKVEIESEETYG